MRWSNVVTIALFVIAAVTCALVGRDQLAFGFAISAAALAVPYQTPPAGGAASPISEVSGAFRRVVPPVALIAGVGLAEHLQRVVVAIHQG